METPLLQKSLTKALHNRILELVGLCHKPCSSREIEVKFIETFVMKPLQGDKRKKSDLKHSDIYRVIKELAVFNKGKIGVPFIKYTLKDDAKQEIVKLGGLSTLNENMGTLNNPNIQITRDIFGAGADQWRKSEQISKIEDDPKNFRYYLTLKGFVLFLLGSESSGVTDSKINKVIKALTENEYTKKDYPFLWKYHVLDEIEGRNFKVKLLKRISFEAQYLLLREDDIFLKYWITSQFHSAVSWLHGGIGSVILPYIIHQNNKNIRPSSIVQWINDYDKKMLEFSLSYVRHEEAYISRLLELKEKRRRLN